MKNDNGGEIGGVYEDYDQYRAREVVAFVGEDEGGYIEVEISFHHGCLSRLKLGDIVGLRNICNEILKRFSPH